MLELVPSLEVETFLEKTKAENIGIIGFDGFRIDEEGGANPLLERIADFSTMTDETETYAEFLEWSHRRSIEVFREMEAEGMFHAENIYYEICEFTEDDWNAAKARQKLRGQG